MDKLDHEESFVSMKKFFEDSDVRARYISRSDRHYAEENPIEDEFLASILNPDGIVQIGEWIIKVNLEQEKVSVLHEDNARLYDELVNDQFDNKKIYLFNTHDDVLDMLEEGVLGTVGEKERAQGWWRRDRRAERDDDKYDDDLSSGTTIPCKNETCIPESRDLFFLSFQNEIYGKA